MHKNYDGERRFGKTNGRAWNAKVQEMRKIVGVEIEKVMADYAAFRAAFNLTRNQEQARELVQESACRALKNAHSYKPARPFIGWFCGIMRNRFLDKEAGSRKMVSIESFDGEGFGLKDILACERDAVEDMVGVEQTRQAVHAAMKGLSRSHRRVLTLCFLQDMSYQDAAEVLGVPKSTVGTRVHRAKKALRALLSDAEVRP